MADTTFRGILPALKAVDLGDGTYAISVVGQPDTAVYETFTDTLPALRAVDLGDGTHALVMEAQ